MERLNGGEFLLDLTPITIEESIDSETYTNITNAKVLEQLTNLKRYIPNEKAIKPVWVKFVNDETDEIVVVKGELAKTIGDEEFEIHIKTKRYELTIHIEFTQAVNDNSDPIDDWYIDTNDAKYLFLSDLQSTKGIIESDDIGNLELKGNLHVDGILQVDEYELDADIELTNLPTNLSKYFAHARISNGKLNIVLAFGVGATQSVADTTETWIGAVQVSEEVYDKLIPYVSAVISTEVAPLVSMDTSPFSTGSICIRVRKGANNKIDFYLAVLGATIVSNTRIARIEMNYLL